MGVLLPYVLAPVAVALIFSDLYGDRFGLVNHLLGLVGVDPVQWHKDVLPSHVAIATMVNFRWIGYNALIFLAAMQAVPGDYYEAAMIDGAGRLLTFVFTVRPRRRRPVVADVTLYLYQLGWTQKNVGRAAAVAWMLILIIVVFAVVNFLVTRRIASKGPR